MLSPTRAEEEPFEILDPAIAYSFRKPDLKFELAGDDRCDSCEKRGPVAALVGWVHLEDFGRKRERARGYPVYGMTVPVEIRLHFCRVCLRKALRSAGALHRTHTSATVRFDVMKRDGFRCQICGRNAQDGVKLVVDHKVPVAEGGTNDRSNLWTLCSTCNYGKMTEPLDDL